MEPKPFLDIQLLGNFRVTYRGQTVQQVQTARLEALLAYLLLHRNMPIPRQRLAFMFWPETSDKQARANLRRLLFQLRSAFPEIDNFILVDSDNLAWNLSAPFRLDVAEFEAATAAAKELPELRRALELYAGDLLPELYLEWVLEERDHLARTYEQLLEKSAEAFEEAGEYSNAIDANRRLLRRDPLREETYQNLMRLHGKQGDLISVRRTFTACKNALRKELDIEPDQETILAYRHWSKPGHKVPPKQRIAEKRIYRTTNLPATLDSFFGRRDDLKQIQSKVAEKRLVTLTGFGGVGKTRLALAAAGELKAEFPGGVWWVELASTTNANLVQQTFADSLGLQKEPQRSLLDSLVEWLSVKRQLLVVDNCEHLAASVAQFLLHLLKACPELHVLATSRVRLKAAGEAVFPVQPLPTPTIEEKTYPKQELRVKAFQEFPSMELFVERATAILPSFQLDQDNLTAIAQICQSLDGIPLAIELAAGQIHLLSPQGIADRLAHDFRLLRGGVTELPRQQTMSATLDWSYRLLEPSQQVLQRRLAIFTGGFTLEDVEAVAVGEGLPQDQVLDALAGLIDHSLVISDEFRGERYYRLHEVTRQYAEKRLGEAAELDLLHKRHLVHFSKLAILANERIRGREQVTWLRRLDLAFDNLRTALAWGALQINNPVVVEQTLRLAGSLYYYLYTRGRLADGLWLTQTALDAANGLSPEIHLDPVPLGYTHLAASGFNFLQGNVKSAEDHTATALRLFRQAGHLPGLAHALHHNGITAMNRYELELAETYLQEGLQIAQSIEDSWLITLLLNEMGVLYDIKGEPKTAYQFHAEQLQFTRQEGDHLSQTYALLGLCDLSIQLGKYQDAEAFAQESMVISEAIGEVRALSDALRLQAKLAFRAGRNSEGIELYRQSLSIAAKNRNQHALLFILEMLALELASQENHPEAISLFSALEGARRRFGLQSYLPDAEAIDEYLQRVKLELGESGFSQIWEQGQLTTIEQVLQKLGVET